MADNVQTIYACSAHVHMTKTTEHHFLELERSFLVVLGDFNDDDWHHIRLNTRRDLETLPNLPA